MHKKIFVLFLFCLLFLSGISPVWGAEEGEMLVNGGFDVLNSNGSVYGWTYHGDAFGIKTEDVLVQSGQYALRYKSAAPVYIGQKLTGIVDTCAYEISAWVYMINGTKRDPRIKLEFIHENGGGNGETTLQCENVIKDKWVEQTWSVIPPEGTVAARMYVRYQGTTEADFIWDNISVKGEHGEGFEEVTLPESAPLVKLYPDKAEFLYSEEEATEFLKNGSFENVTTANKPFAWTLKETGGTVDSTAKIFHDGRMAVDLNVTTQDSGTFLYQTVKNMLPCAEYKLTGQVRVAGKPGKAAVKVCWRDNSGQIAEREIPIQIKTPDVWQPFEFSLLSPYKTAGAQIWLRTNTKNVVSYDAVSLRGKMDFSAIPDNMELKPSAPGTGELFVNGDLEEDAGGAPAGWIISGNGWDTAYTTEKTFSGTHALKLHSEAANVSPYIEQDVIIQEGCVYQLSMALNIQENYSHYGLMPEFHYYNSTETLDANKIGFETAPSFLKTETFGEWRQRKWEFTPPAGTKAMKIWVKWFRQGTCYVDDISLRIVSNNVLDTNDIFYYSDLTDGIATAKASRAVYRDLTGFTTNFCLKDGETVLHEKKDADISGGETKYYFPIAAMTEIGKAYTVEAVFRDAAGNELNRMCAEVYKYDRPTVLSKDGRWIENGEPWNPVIGYHVPSEKFPRVSELGVNVVQTYSKDAKPARIRGILDEVHAYGMKALVVLYVGDGAGALKNIENTKACVETIKDHPAVFAYAIDDEPYAGKGRTVEVDDELAEAYRIIRAIDPKHPVLITDAKLIFEPLMKRSDIMNLDLYPKGDNGADIIDSFPKAVEASYNNDSIMMITQMMNYNGNYPSPDTFRSWIYQGFMVGAKSTGFFAFDQLSPDGIPVEEADLGEALDGWNKKEKDLAFAFFTNKLYPLFAEGEITENYAWRIFLKDGQLYVYALNRRQNDPQSFDIPLVSDNGRVRVSGFTGSVFAGGENAALSGGDTFSVTLTPGQAAVYTLTPSEIVDPAALEMTSFTDLDAYSWAKEQIVALEKNEVVNALGEGLFAPGQNITRGDFAMFLIRALDLRSGAIETFTDVPQDAYYAKEIAIGKALGIFKGMGDGTYGAETPISRQDLMVICARAMRLVAKLDKAADAGSLGAFSDGALVSDYAKEDVAAMTAAGIIQGNADGTVNPLGNTTRAEAAVIMHRIAMQ